MVRLSRLLGRHRRNKSLSETSGKKKAEEIREQQPSSLSSTSSSSSLFSDYHTEYAKMQVPTVPAPAPAPALAPVPVPVHAQQQHLISTNATHCTTTTTQPSLTILDLQSTIDYLTTKLEQSQSRVLCLQDENEQLRALFSATAMQLQPGDDDARDDAADTSARGGHDPPVGKGHGQVTKQSLDSNFYPSFWNLSQLMMSQPSQTPQPKQPTSNAVESSMKTNANANANAKVNANSSGNSLFTYQDGVRQMMEQYQSHLSTVMSEKQGMQRELMQLQVQNQVQTKTMASMEQNMQKQQKQSHQQQSWTLSASNSRKQHAMSVVKEEVNVEDLIESVVQRQQHQKGDNDDGISYKSHKSRRSQKAKLSSPRHEEVSPYSEQLKEQQQRLLQVQQRLLHATTKAPMSELVLLLPSQVQSVRRARASTAQTVLQDLDTCSTYSSRQVLL